MAWNSYVILKSLADMPTMLDDKYLEAIQSEIDKDKYVCSMEVHMDLCGEYAPFCVFCDKNVNTPCAVAFIKMKQMEGLPLEIAMTEDENEPAVESINQAGKKFEQLSEKTYSDPTAQKISQNEVKQVIANEQITHNFPTEKKRIRIAIAQRKK